MLSRYRTLLMIAAAALPACARVELKPGAGIRVPSSEPACVRRAAQDLAADVRKVAGWTPAVTDERAACGKPCIAITSRAPGLHGKWEAWRLAETPGGIEIAGSDERGAIFGIYTFAERYLGVDPLYFWTGCEPARRMRLSWAAIRLESGEPTFRYRGWFINDEDLLTEWRDSGGRRDIDYPFYHQVTAPEVLERVFEAALRLQMNLIIPASFTDLDNPAEAHMIEAATRRGLFVSMHHVEPLGVSAFAFGHYWKARGREVPFSFFTRRAEFDEVWRHYAAQWARFPGVIWQLGLRGIADRPMWVSDPAAPKSDQERGKLISDAVARQWEIVRSVDTRPQPPATTTLWMEGSDLNRKGLLRVPKGVAMIFSDNSPGWKMQEDFYQTPRDAGRNYGIYYHHALWGSGPHLVQAVSPWKTYQIVRQAVERGSHWYAILNVSNVREFALGLDASARMLRNFKDFNPDRFFGEWCRERFGASAPAAESAYRKFFAAYLESPKTGTPDLLDGLALHAGERILGGFDKARPQAELLERVRRQRAALEQATADVPGEFFQTNFTAQRGILIGILKWVECAAMAVQQRERGDTAAVAAELRRAHSALQEVRSAQALAARGDFRDWYRGDRKMDLSRAERLTTELIKTYAH